MTETLSDFFSELSPVAEEQVLWLGGAIRLRLRVYLTDLLPALEHITSVRAVLSTDDGCAVLRNADGMHALPGGRREADESLESTLRHELLEETGCSVSSLQRLGVLHFQHLTAKPADYRYPYPDFAQAVFSVRGAAHFVLSDPDGYETSVEFVPPSRLDTIALPGYQRLLIAGALQLLG